MADRDLNDVNAAVSDSTYSRLEFEARDCRLVHVRQASNVCTVERVLIGAVIPSRVGFGTLISSLSHVLREIIDSAYESEGERQRRSVLNVLCMVVRHRARSIIRYCRISASVNREDEFPLSVQVNGVLERHALRRFAVAVEVVSAHYCDEEVLVVKSFLVARLSVSYSRLRLIRPLGVVLSGLFLNGVPACEREERITVAVAFNGLEEAVAARHRDGRMSVLVEVRSAAWSKDRCEAMEVTEDAWSANYDVRFPSAN